MDVTISTLQRDAFEHAEAYYLRHWNENHTRKNPSDDWDERKFLAWARLWLVAKATYNRMNNWLPERDYHDEVMEAYEADFEECLVAMYG